MHYDKRLLLIILNLAKSKYECFTSTIRQMIYRVHFIYKNYVDSLQFAQYLILLRTILEMRSNFLSYDEEGA